MFSATKLLKRFHSYNFERFSYVGLMQFTSVRDYPELTYNLIVGLFENYLPCSFNFAFVFHCNVIYTSGNIGGIDCDALIATVV